MRALEVNEANESTGRDCHDWSVGCSVCAVFELETKLFLVTRYSRAVENCGFSQLLSPVDYVAHAVDYTAHGQVSDMDGALLTCGLATVILWYCGITVARRMANRTTCNLT